MFFIEILEPKKYFLKQGEIADKLGFVKSGLLRSYYYDDQAREVTLQFFQKGSVVISADSFNNRTPATENIVAYENTELITTTYIPLFLLILEV
ncbi:MAG: cyclic nucleotide-binding domain-containing protein [Chlorobi bacterium]|nr:cyclic nucleotide-binding domain-containing protein [Chlorobiota bacterium]